MYEFLTEHFLIIIIKKNFEPFSELFNDVASCRDHVAPVIVYGLYQGFENHCFNIKKSRARVRTNTQKQHDDLISLLFYFLGRKVG